MTIKTIKNNVVAHKNISDFIGDKYSNSFYSKKLMTKTKAKATSLDITPAERSVTLFGSFSFWLTLILVPVFGWIPFLCSFFLCVGLSTHFHLVGKSLKRK